MKRRCARCGWLSPVLLLLSPEAFTFGSIPPTEPARSFACSGPLREDSTGVHQRSPAVAGGRLSAVGFQLSVLRYSADPVGIDSFPNLYAYANLNPAFFVDPYGLCAEFGELAQRYQLNKQGQVVDTYAQYRPPVTGEAVVDALSTVGKAVAALASFTPPGAAVASFNALAHGLETGYSTGNYQPLAVSAALTFAPVGISKAAPAVSAVAGEATGAAVAGTETRLLAAGTEVPNAGGVIRSFAQEGDQFYYRVFSSSQQGRFLTAVPPSSSAFAREALALSPGNQATYIQQVLVPNGTTLQRSRALPAFGARGGAEQFELLQQIPPENFGLGALLP